MKPSTLLRALALIPLSLLLAGCDQQPPAPEATPAVSTVSVASISPAIEDELRVDQVVELRVELDYSLGAPAGNVGLVVQTAQGEVLLQNIQPIEQGSGRLSLQADFTVPATEAIHVVMPLSHRGRSATSVVEIRSYAVATP